MPSYAVPGSQSVQTSEKGRQAVEKKTSEKQHEERRGNTYPPLPSSPRGFHTNFLDALSPLPWSLEQAMPYCPNYDDHHLSL